MSLSEVRSQDVFPTPLLLNGGPQTRIITSWKLARKTGSQIPLAPQREKIKPDRWKGKEVRQCRDKNVQCESELRHELAGILS